jgi:hypothetical protein
MIWRIIKNIALWVLVSELDLRGTATKLKLSKEQLDEARAKVWMNKEYIAVLKDQIATDVQRNFYEGNHDKITFRRGGSFRTFQELLRLQAGYKRYMTRERKNEIKKA